MPSPEYDKIYDKLNDEYTSVSSSKNTPSKPAQNPTNPLKIPKYIVYIGVYIGVIVGLLALKPNFISYSKKVGIGEVVYNSKKISMKKVIIYGFLISVPIWIGIFFLVKKKILNLK